MEAIDFKERNIIFAENQPEYNSLPALKKEGVEGEVVTCWKLSFRERIKILLTGKLWLALLTFNKPLTPTFLTVNKNDLINKTKIK